VHAKFHLDLSNRLATVHERHRQDRQDNGSIAYGKPFYKRSPKKGTELVYIAFRIVTMVCADDEKVAGKKAPNFVTPRL